MRLQVGKGMDEYLSQLGNLETSAPETIEKAVYQGASVIADAIKDNIRKLPVDDKRQDKVSTLKSIQKKGLIDSFGIAKMRNDNGYVNVKAGFDGYNGLKSKKYPKGCGLFRICS